MAKQSGLGARFFVAGYNLSGDTGAMGRIAGGPSGTQDVTGLDKEAFERIGLLRDGGMDWTSFFNDAAGQAHPVLSALPTGDRVMTYMHRATIGAPSASMVGKQINYDPTRGADGSLTIAVQAQANGYGLEWGQALTAGIRTDTGATNGTSIDTTASAAFGAQAWLHVFAFTGTDATVKIQDSADNSTFADVTGLTFTAVGSAPTSERIATAAGATIRRYLRAVTTTSAGFSNLQFAVQVTKNESAVTW